MRDPVGNVPLYLDGFGPKAKLGGAGKFFGGAFPIYRGPAQASVGRRGRCTMDDEATHLTPGEVRRIIGRLRGPDLVRLGALARVWATGLRQHDLDDLLNEALDRMMSGRRLWPIDVPLPAFLSQVMRSIACQWRQEDRREPLKEDKTERVFEEESSNPAASYDIGDLISRIRRSLGIDPQAQGVFDHILADSDREDAQAVLGMNATQYDTARRRMVRRLFEAFHAGWNHDHQRL